MVLRGDRLLIGGQFLKVGGQTSVHFAQFGCPDLACIADCDQNGALDIDDFVCFQTRFALSDLGADCDANGALTIDDFLCFQIAFATGC